MILLYRRVRHNYPQTVGEYTSINSDPPPPPSERSTRFLSADPEDNSAIITGNSGRYNGQDWEKTWDDEEQRFYYHNKATGESKWAEDD